MQKLNGGKDWCIQVSVPSGFARLVFNPIATSELTVVDELLWTRLYQCNHKHDVFIDCGAFRGISTIYLQDQAQPHTVIAFEPQEENFEVLKSRLAAYYPEIECIKAAVGAQNGEAYFEGGGVGGHISTSGALTVVRRLSEVEPLLQAEKLLLKMDVEGAEAEILPDIREKLPLACSFWLETHFPEAVARNLLRPYEEAGFDVILHRARQDEKSDVVFIDWELRRGT